LNAINFSLQVNATLDLKLEVDKALGEESLKKVHKVCWWYFVNGPLNFFFTSVFTIVLFLPYIYLQNLNFHNILFKEVSIK